MMDALTVLLIIFGTIVVIPCYVAHIGMMRDEHPVQYGSFFDFKRQFEMYDGWYYDDEFDSFFGNGEFRQYYLHANIYIFDKKGMWVDPLSYMAIFVYLKLQKYSIKPKAEKWKW